MAEHEILKNAPIEEALIDIRIKVKDDFAIQQLQSLGEKVGKQYPEQKERLKWEQHIDFKKEEVPIHHRKKIMADGYIFVSEDKKQVFQARIDGFTFSRLRPYMNWENLRDEASYLWTLYKEIISPEITRIAVRFINKIEIPFPLGNFNEYLIGSPIIPNEWPQGIASFFTRFVVYEQEVDAYAVIIQALEQGITENAIPIILDIDVFKEKQDCFKDDAEAWHIIEALRNIKNRIFFSSITEKTKELFL